ncbi:MAG: glycosyltransferase [Rubricoccaceae bacterium]|nr:glycosyltransferase [Rubricoccaceae bacterium]
MTASAHIDAPKVSIGLPVFNGARYLREAVEDFLQQSFEDFELIISDNASFDDTETIGVELAARDRRVRYVRNTRNIGALPNANRVLELATGTYFCLAAHDDRHSPEFLERLVNALEADPNAVLAYGRCTLIDTAGNPLIRIRERDIHVTPGGRGVDYDQKLEESLPDDAVKRFRAVLRSNDVNAPIHGLFRRDALLKTAGHQFHGSDRLIVGHAALLGTFAFVDAPLFSFRVHPDSTFFLTREEWAARETGRDNADSPLAALQTLVNFWKATRQAELSLFSRARARAAILGYLFRPAAIRRALLPNQDNYFGWKKWPWQQTIQPTVAVPDASKTAHLSHSNIHRA